MIFPSALTVWSHAEVLIARNSAVMKSGALAILNSKNVEVENKMRSLGKINGYETFFEKGLFMDELGETHPLFEDTVEDLREN